MASILVVCTGNICRSPMAEGFLLRSVRLRFPEGGPSVFSAGLAGLDGSAAHPDSVLAARERGLDLSAHVARPLLRSDVKAVDLIVAMAAEHRDEVRRSAPRVASRTFTLKELVRLLEALPAPAPGQPFDRRVLRDRVKRADRLRAKGGAPPDPDEDVEDPLGLPAEAFREMAEELEAWCTRLVDALFGRLPVSTSSDADR